MNSKDEKKCDENIPGAFLTKPFEVATVTELRRWLKCRKASTKGLKCELVERCKIYSADPERRRVALHEDENPSKPQSTIHPNKENINNCELWTRSLTGLSQKFGEGKIYEHLGGTAEKHRVAGYKMFKCDKVENMLVSRNNSQQTSCFELNAIVAASYSKDRYKCNVKISNSSGKVTNAVCTCKSGAMGLCKHISAVLFQLNDYKQSGQEFIQEAIACTEKPRAWGVRKKRPPLVSKSFEELTFVKHTPEKAEKNIEFSKKRREYCSLPMSKQDLSPTRLKRLSNDMKSTRAMWSELILEHCDESENTSDKDLTMVTSTIRANDFTGLIANGLTDSVDLQSKTVQSQIKKVIDDMPPLTKEEINAIEEGTRGQSFNDKWFFYRRDRITASVAGEIVHRRLSTPPDALVKRICQYNAPTIKPGPCKHGIDLEAEARKKYVSICQVSGQELTVDEVGLIIDSRYSWLAASVDGVINIITPSKDIGILEIKCPYVDADSQGAENIPQTLVELCMTRKNFYLTVDEKGNISGLNKNHNYYFQVQTQMGILDLKWCDFMVYYKVKNTKICDAFVYHVQFDPILYHNAIIPKLYDFYLKGVVPEIITRRVKRGERLYPNTSNYVYASN